VRGLLIGSGWKDIKRRICPVALSYLRACSKRTVTGAYLSPSKSRSGSALRKRLVEQNVELMADMEKKYAMPAETIREAAAYAKERVSLFPYQI